MRCSSLLIASVSALSVSRTCCFLSAPKPRMFLYLSSNSANNNNDELMDDDFLAKSLQRAKNDILGAPIPPEVQKETAKEAESAFLAAMRDVSEEFATAKDQLGSDGAVDLFLQKIEEEDRRNQQEEDDEEDDSVFE